MSSPSDSSLSPIISTKFTTHQEAGAAVCMRLDKYVPRHGADNTVHFIRIFFRYLALDGKCNLAEDVDGCETDQNVRELWQNIDTGILIPMYSVENLLAENVDPVSRNEQSALRQACLARDGYQCVISKTYDSKHRPRKCPNHAPLQASHIIPFSMGDYSPDSEGEELEVSRTWATLYRYFPGLRSFLNFHSSDLNCVENAMMLLAPLHTEFGEFHLVFEETETANKYQIKTFEKFAGAYSCHVPSTRVVTFTSHDTRYAVPNPHLLAVHAAIGNILSASGRGEQIEKLVRDLGSGGFELASDGSTNIAELLAVGNLILRTATRHETAGKIRQRQKSPELPGAENIRKRAI
ncbi:HNH endonuclease signature motif containing protein [Aspergillus alliaceus]|uniref:HNH endonuclease signature motif containing protein n=1 Tax=Petromyces alliaceus TaxID=209559 RepID=UPI0012A452AB|nr:uncharacterized protein BDW43DRAFT_321029 [Aspergillus alliaceus]KAB8230779.1 hypothetical protein BDW43DRAFT_321029 [Aspergillus alliaceus]